MNNSGISSLLDNLKRGAVSSIISVNTIEHDTLFPNKVLAKWVNNGVANNSLSPCKIIPATDKKKHNELH